jgi:hypothetical protein
VRPGPGPFEREATLAGLVAEADAFVAALTMRRDMRATHLTHPFFGRLTPMQGIELCALHTRHHTKQLPGAAEHRVDGARLPSAPAEVGTAD